MTLAVAARIARRELRGGLRGFRIFLACLALGVAAIAAVGMVKSAIQAGLEREGAALLGGDAQARFTYRFARPEERAWLDRHALRVSETVDFRSMAVAGPEGQEERGLTQVRAVDNLYPLVGQPKLAPEIPLAQALAGDGTHPGAVMERALVDRLDLQTGDVFRLGTQEFVLGAVLVRYPDNGSGGFGLGPRIIVLLKDLADSGLLVEGTLFNTEYRVDLPDDADLDVLRAEVAAQFEQSGMDWRDSRRGADGAERFINRLGSFLVLVGLSGLAVGGVGVSAAVRAWLSGRIDTIATLRSLGATRSLVFQIYFLQVGVLTTIGILTGLLIGTAVPLALAGVITASLPIPAQFALYPAPLVEAALYGALTALIFTLWPLARVEDIRAATLFRDAFAAGRLLPRARYIIVTGLLIAALVGAAIWFSGTAWLTLWTLGGIAGALLLLVVAALGTRWLAQRMRRRAVGRPGLRLALAAIGARGGETTSVVLSLGLGLSVLAAVGQIDGNLRAAIVEELPRQAPSYFFVDIQPDQIEGFRARVDTDPEVSRVEAAPMLRGIITQINGAPAEEFAGDHWVIRGDRGVTYSAEPPPGTTITEGEWWPADYTGEPLVSFAEEEAKEIGLSIGDTVTINILGREITARIASFRVVNFETAGIGFVMSMNPAALAGAPHSWIATVYSSPQAEGPILRDLADAYPNITAIRIRDAVEQVARIVAGISSATRYGAGATLVTGFLVLIGAAAAGERARAFESAVLRTLGATRGRILRSFALRAALLGLTAGAVALTAGLVGGWAVMTFVMETDFRVIWPNALGIVFGGMLATLVAGLLFALRPLATRPAQVLRARE